MLIFTDETSHKYRRELYDLETLRSRRAVDGDALVKQAIAASGDDHGVYNPSGERAAPRRNVAGYTSLAFKAELCTSRELAATAATVAL